MASKPPKRMKFLVMKMLKDAEKSGGFFLPTTHEQR